MSLSFLPLAYASSPPLLGWGPGVGNPWLRLRRGTLAARMVVFQDLLSSERFAEFQKLRNGTFSAIFQPAEDAFATPANTFAEKVPILPPFRAKTAKVSLCSLLLHQKKQTHQNRSQQNKTTDGFLRKRPPTVIHAGKWTPQEQLSSRRANYQASQPKLVGALLNTRQSKTNTGKTSVLYNMC